MAEAANQAGREVDTPTDRPAVGLVTAGHVFNDVNQGAVPALLPFLVLERGLSYAEAGGLLMAATVLSSVTQPVFGWFADARAAAWMMPTGLFAAGLGVSLAGLAPSYPLVVAAILLSGLGVAAFHPEAARAANHAAGTRKSTGMSFFAVGGNAGFALGPVVTTPLLVAFGVRGAVYMIVPAGLMALVLVINLRRFTAPVSGSAATGGAEQPGQEWGAFVRLTGVVVLRSITFFSLVAFVPLYWVEVLGSSPAAGNTALTVLLGAGIAGTLAGGWFGDRHGARVIVVVGLVATGALLAVLLRSGATGWAATGVLVVLGVALYLPFAVIITMGQAYLWRRVGTASGVTIGLSMTVGGLGAPLLGAVADRQGLQAALLWVALIPVAAAVLALTLPAPRPRV